MRKKKGGGEKKKKPPPPPPLRFRQLRPFRKIQLYRILGKCLKYFQNFFCCLKKIICTHLCTRLWPRGILAIFAFFHRKIFIILEKMRFHHSEKNAVSPPRKKMRFHHPEKSKCVPLWAYTLFISTFVEHIISNIFEQKMLHKWIATTT